MESWVGERRASEIKARMSVSSKKKAPQLRKLNEDPNILTRRLQSRQFHDRVVRWLAYKLKERGCRVFTLSEYIKERRIPDAILYVDGRLIALEVETEKRWKPSHASTEERLAHLNGLCGFFDQTKVVFPDVNASLNEVGPAFLSHILT